MRLFRTEPVEPSAEELAVIERLNAIADRGRAERATYPAPSETKRAAARPRGRPRARKAARR
jgi:hypothetical protein